MTRRRKQKGGGGIAAAKGAYAAFRGINKLASLLVKDKGAKQALSESLGSKLKRGWLGINAQMGKKIDRDMKKKGYVKMKNYKRSDLQRELCEQSNWKNWASGPGSEQWRCRKDKATPAQRKRVKSALLRSNPSPYLLTIYKR